MSTKSKAENFIQINLCHKKSSLKDPAKRTRRKLRNRRSQAGTRLRSHTATLSDVWTHSRPRREGQEKVTQAVSWAQAEEARTSWAKLTLLKRFIYLLSLWLPWALPPARRLSPLMASGGPLSKVGVC